MRVGFDAGSETCLELAPMLERAGACMITLHARTRSQFYEGYADWSMIKKLKERMGIPVVGNGDIVCAQDALRMLEETRCDGVAVGRGAQGNPWIFEQIRDVLAGKPIREPSPEEKLNVLMRHARMLAELKCEEIAVKEMRRHVVCYVRGMRDAAKVRTKVNAVASLEDLEALMKSFFLGTME